MHANYWHERWDENRIGFHNAEAHVTLVRHFAALGLAKGARVFVPLCGKSRDIGWLLAQGCRVAGAELSRVAIEQLFKELGVVPEISKVGALERFTAPGLEIFVGDIMALKQSVLGPVDAVYDRAALVALPPEMRRAYAAHVTLITGSAAQLLISFDYDQAEMAGPPFSVPDEELRSLYGTDFQLDLLESTAVDGGLKGFCPALETCWHLRAGS